MFPPRIRSVLGLNIKAENMLDVGCGNGIYGLAIKEAFGVKELYGVDIGGKVLEEAQKQSIKTAQVNLDNTDLPYQGDYFDVVFMGEVIEHMANPDKALSEIFRVLKPNGYFILSTPNIACWNDRLFLLFGYQPYSIPIGVNYWGVGAFWEKCRSKKLYDDRYLKATSGLPIPHVQFFTVRAVVSILMIHNFKVLRIIGNPADQITFSVNGLIRKMITSVDSLVAKMLPSLASDVTVIAQKVNGIETINK